MNIPLDTLARLRVLRLWHWQHVVRYQKHLNNPRTNRLKRREYHSLHTLHLGAVQALNEFFPIGDTAERDAANG